MSAAESESGRLLAIHYLEEVGNGLRILVKTRYGLLAISSPKSFLSAHSTFAGYDRVRDDGGIDVVIEP